MLYFQAKSNIVVHVTYILSNIDKALAFEWISQNLDNKKFKIHFILLHTKETEMERFLIHNNIPFARIFYKNKLDFPRATFQCMVKLIQWKTTIVHCHLLDADLVGLTSAWLLKIKKRIYTRHHSSFMHAYFPKGVWYDKFFNAIATDIIAISNVVKEVLLVWEKAPKEKVKLIPHGFEWNALENVSQQRVDKFLQKYPMIEGKIVIGVIAKFFELKGIHYIIPAFKEIHSKFPQTILVLANASGPFEKQLNEALKTLPTTSFQKIIFENDLGALYHHIDILIHVPVDMYAEAFGQVYVEALALGKPSIFSASGIATDILAKNDWILSVPFEDTEAIFSRLEQVMSNLEEYKSIYQSHASAFKSQFSLEKMISSLEKVYES